MPTSSKGTSVESKVEMDGSMVPTCGVTAIKLAAAGVPLEWVNPLEAVKQMSLVGELTEGQQLRRLKFWGVET